MQETIRARVDSQLKEQFKFAAKSHGQNASQSLREFMADSPKSTITPFADFPHIEHPPEDLERVRKFVFGRNVICYLVRMRSCMCSGYGMGEWTEARLHHAETSTFGKEAS